MLNWFVAVFLIFELISGLHGNFFHSIHLVDRFYLSNIYNIPFSQPHPPIGTVFVLCAPTAEIPYDLTKFVMAKPIAVIYRTKRSFNARTSSARLIIKSATTEHVCEIHPVVR